MYCASLLIDPELARRWTNTRMITVIAMPITKINMAIRVTEVDCEGLAGIEFWVIGFLLESFTPHLMAGYRCCAVPSYEDRRLAGSCLAFEKT